jgi:two-component system OmpR family response regulator
VTSSNGNRIPVRTSRSGTAHEIVLALARRGLTVARLDGPKVTLSGGDGGRRVPDLLVLDGGSAPDLEALRRLATEVRALPVLFLLGPDDDPVLAVLSTDYVVAPVTASEVAARLGPALGERTAARHALADLELDEDAHEVRRGGSPVELSVTEYRLLRYLLVNAGRVLTRDQILDHVWGYDFSGRTHVIETYVSYLRRKLDALGPPLIRTVRGVGYVMRAPEE